MKHLKTALSASSVLGPLISTAAPLCAGGVCTVAAPLLGTAVTGAAPAASLLALSGSGAAGLLAASSTPVRLFGTAAPVFPWTNLVSLLLLSGVFAWDIRVFSQKGQWGRGVLLWLAFVLLILAETWQPHGQSHPQAMQWAGLAVGLPFFLGLPYLGELSDGLLAFFAAILDSVGLLALALVFGLPFFLGWQPCPLCWVERGALAMTVLPLVLTGVLDPPGYSTANYFPQKLHIRWWRPVFWFAGLLATAWQFLEFHHAVIPPALCTSAAVSCATAASRLLWGVPIVLWALVLFATGFAVSLATANPRTSVRGSQQFPEIRNSAEECVGFCRSRGFG